MHKSPTVFRRKVPILLGLLAVVTIAAFFFLRYQYPSAPKQPNFTGYVPHQLPAGIYLTQESLVRQHDTVLSLWSFNYRIAFNRDLRIYEGFTDNQYPRLSTCYGLGGVCIMRQASNGTIYRVWYNTYNGKPYGLEVNLVKKNTIISIAVDDKETKRYVAYDWRPLIDSLQATDLSHRAFTRVTVKHGGG